jgi:multimeric flavodoxin WrbA
VPRLLLVHHTVSPATAAMFDAVAAGARDDAIEGVEVVARAALAATPIDVLEADACILGTPANIGYMSGALKHFFDQVYYPCLDATVGRPYALYVHGDSDAAGAIRGVETIVTGLGWRRVHLPVVVTGRPAQADLDACWELGATVAAGLTMDV